MKQQVMTAPGKIEFHRWYNTVTREGNYWSDYTGTGAYQIAGPAGAKDPYPLDEQMKPIPQPTTVSSELTSVTTPTPTAVSTSGVIALPVFTLFLFFIGVIGYYRRKGE